MQTERLTNQWASLHERDLKRLQLAKLRRYLKQVVLPFSPRYRELFERIGVVADDLRTLDDWRRIPFTSKADLVGSPDDPQASRNYILQPDKKVLARRPSMVLRAMLQGRGRLARELEAEYRPVFMTSTTGRSADPVPFLYTRHDLRNLASAGRRIFEVCGARTDQKLVNLFPYAPHLAFWLAHYGGEAFGVFVASTGGGKVMGTDGNLRLIQRIQPDVLIGMPTFIYHVLLEAVERRLRWPNLFRIVLGGEKVAGGLRRKLIDLAGRLEAGPVDVVAIYGFTEAKCAWPECPVPDGGEPAGYHVFPDHGLIEVIDPDTGETVPERHPGEIVFTPLDARGSVVLRYRTGDIIEKGLTFEPCPHCGRRMPRLVGRISRRSEVKSMRLDKIKGTLVDFNELEHVLDDMPRIGAWQIELRKRNDDPLEVDELILHVHKRDSISENRLRHELDQQFAAATELHPNRIVLHTGDEIRELQGVGRELKEERIVDHRPRAEAGEGSAISRDLAGEAAVSNETPTEAQP